MRQKPCLLKIKDYKKSMTTKVTGKNMVSIPVAMARHFGIRAGYEFDWKPSRHPEEMIVRVIPDPRGLSRRLKGAGAKAGGRRSAVAELIQERAEESS
jgi:bifunctional DNA-binding transcriptional regulator/antitoxin component of YhaV-PrlF toxin-antitoxin module